MSERSRVDYLKIRAFVSQLRWRATTPIRARIEIPIPTFLPAGPFGKIIFDAFDRPEREGFCYAVMLSRGGTLGMRVATDERKVGLLPNLDGYVNDTLI